MTKSVHTLGGESLGQAPHTPDLFEEDQPMDDANVHDPGPSFVPDDVPTARLAEMPAWLQTFAAQEMPDLEEAVPDVEVDLELEEPEQLNAAVELPSDDIVLPDWLQDDGPEVDVIEPLIDDIDIEDFSIDAVAAAPYLDGIDDPVSTNPDTFISEDDLPDWLRAFSEESAPEPGLADVADVAAGVVAPEAVQVRVPPVENIWLSDSDRRALGPGGTLFALLAANKDTDDAEEDLFQESESGVAAAPVAAKGTESPGGTSGQDDAAKRKSRQLLLLTLAIVVLVIMISYMAFR